MAIHTILYYGQCGLNWERLKTNPNDFQIKGPDDQFRAVDPPSKKVDGICFGYMNKADGLKANFAVKVGENVLDKPVRLVTALHTDGKGFGPQASQFGDEAARCLLEDIICENPAQSAALSTVYEQYFHTRPPDCPFIPQEIDEEEAKTYREGTISQIRVNRYERSASARRVCLAKYNNDYKCQICKFDFYETYGEVGRDFIHVHHLTPLAEIGEAYEVNPETDLLPVCPNCHAIIHRKKHMLTPDEVRVILAQNKERQ